MAACGTADAADGHARAAYLAVVRVVHLSLSALRRTAPIVVGVGIGIGHHVSPLLLLDQGFVDHGNPAPQPVVELVLGAVVLHGDVLVVKLGIRDALILVELVGVGRKRPVLGLRCHGVGVVGVEIGVWREESGP